MTGDGHLAFFYRAVESLVVTRRPGKFFLPSSICLVRTETCPWCAGAVVVFYEAGKIKHQSTVPTGRMGLC